MSSVLNKIICLCDVQMMKNVLTGNMCADGHSCVTNCDKKQSNHIKSVIIIIKA